MGFDPFIVSQIGRFLVRVLLSRSVRSPFVGFVCVLYKSFVWCRYYYYYYYYNVMTKFIVNNRTDVLKTDFDLFFTIINCQFVRSRSLTHRTNYKFMCLSAY